MQLYFMWLKDHCYHFLIVISFSLSLSDCIKLLPLHIELTSGLAGPIKVLTSSLTSVARSTKNSIEAQISGNVFCFFSPFFLSFCAGWYTLHCLRNREYFIIFSTYIYIGSNIRDSFFLKLCIFKVFIYVMLIKSFWNYHVFCFYLEAPSQLKKQPQPRKCSKWLESYRESLFFWNICIKLFQKD